MNKSNDDTTTNKTKAIIKNQKNKNMSRTNTKMTQCTLDSSTLDREIKTKEPVHRKSKVVTIKLIKTKVYVRD